MADIAMYHQGSRQLQDRHFTRRLADRLVEVLARNAFTDDDHAFIESRPLFFLVTADAEGRPDCSHKGGTAKNEIQPGADVSAKDQEYLAALKKCESLYGGQKQQCIDTAGNKAGEM